MRLLPAAASTIVLLLASTAAIAAPPKACDLLSSQQAAQVWGGTLDPGNDLTKTGIGCLFNRPADQWIMIQLTDVHNWGANSAKIFKMTNTLPPSDHPETIPNLGELNVYSQAPGGDTRLSFYQRGYSVIVTVRGSTNPKLKDTLIQAARQMLPKLP
jgi:hypothetical protein